MNKEPLTIKGIKKHIKRCLHYKKHYDFLGLTENRELTPRVEKLFEHTKIPGYWNWVNGNEKLRQIVEDMEKEADISLLEIIYRKCGLRLSSFK